MSDTDKQRREDCIFCLIAAGNTPAEVVYDGGDTLFFRDISPQAPVHIVAIPKRHLTSLAAMTETDQALFGKLLGDITAVASATGIADGGYRVITNVGSDAGQDVQHVHFHVLGGEPLGPLRCR